MPTSIAIIWGKLKGASKPKNNPIPQALRFPVDKWTAAAARKWIKDNKIKGFFEPASGAKSMADKPESYDRHFAIDRAELDEESRTLEMSFSSAEPVRQWFGWEVLRHNRKAVNLTYLRKSGSFLFNHDPNRIVGPISDVRVDGNKLRATVGFDKTEDGELALERVRSQSLRGASIRYTYDRDAFKEIDDGENEFGVTGLVRDVKRWTPIHLSLVSEPADASVGPGRSADSDGDTNVTTDPVATGAPRDNLDSERGQTMAKQKEKTTKPDAPEKESPDVEVVETRAIDTSDTDDLVAQERKRTTGILAVGEVTGLTDKAADLIASGASLEEATAELRSEWRKQKANRSAPLGNPPPPDIAGNSNTRKWADVRADEFAATLGPRSWATVGDSELGVDGAIPVLEWRSLFRNDPNGFERRVTEMLKSGELKVEDFRLQSAFMALEGLTARQLARDPRTGALRAITTGAFPILTGAIAVSKLREAYDSVDRISERLTTPFPSTRDTDYVDAILSEDPIASVQEGQAYPEGGAVEEYVTVGHDKKGGIISVTDEMVRFDQTGRFLARVNQLGVQAAYAEEKKWIYRMSDDTGLDAKRPYNPSGSATALYQANNTNKPRLGSSGNKITGNALADYTDLDNCMNLLAAMTDHSGNYIETRAVDLVVPFALSGVASKILGSELSPGTVNELNPWGPRGQNQPRLTISKILNGLSTTTWYLGDFQRQFYRKVLIPLETYQMGSGSTEMFQRDIVAQYKVRFDTEFFADDYVYVIQSTE